MEINNWYKYMKSKHKKAKAIYENNYIKTSVGKGRQESRFD